DSSRYMSLSRCFASCRKMHRGKNEIMIKDCGETLAFDEGCLSVRDGKAGHDISLARNDKNIPASDCVGI
ncbi:MAG: hypothetical protein LBP58_02475, partial [Azoarcus sp.]|nr:hypothetical protein [Azoarcus sp.]